MSILDSTRHTEDKIFTQLQINALKILLILEQVGDVVIGKADSFRLSSAQSKRRKLDSDNNCYNDDHFF